MASEQTRFPSIPHFNSLENTNLDRYCCEWWLFWTGFYDTCPRCPPLGFIRGGISSSQTCQTSFSYCTCNMICTAYCNCIGIWMLVLSNTITILWLNRLMIHLRVRITLKFIELIDWRGRWGCYCSHGRHHPSRQAWAGCMLLPVGRFCPFLRSGVLLCMVTTRAWSM